MMRYSKENGLGIELEFNLFTPQNTTHNFVNEYDNTIDFLLSKNSKKYDIYFYDVQYSRKYSDYFIDLKNYLKQDHIDMFENDVAQQICKYNGKWVGLYNQTIPKTWDQLLNTSQIVLKGEAENENFIAYNGLVPDNESCTCTIQELIYSFRKTPASPFPGYTSQEAIDALNKYKEIMEKVSTDEIFFNVDSFSITSIFSSSILFSKFWYIPIPFPDYDKTVIVGKNEGVSGTTIGGYNIGICKFIDDEKRKAALKVIEFFTSKKYQKILATEKQVFSAMTSIYDDEEVCKTVDCKFMKQFQPIARPSFYIDDYDDFSSKFSKNIRNFFIGNLTASEALNNINNVIKIYDVSINPKESVIGFLTFMTTILCILVMLASSFFIFKESLIFSFSYLSQDFWLLTICGFILIMCMGFMEYGVITDLKCQVKFMFHVFGSIFTFIPFIHQLMVHLPFKNGITYWIEMNKYSFLSIITIFNAVICISTFISPYKTLDKKIDNGKNFRICKNGSNSTFTSVLIVEESLLCLSISVLAFLEWNVKKTLKDDLNVINEIIHSSHIHSNKANVNKLSNRSSMPSILSKAICSHYSTGESYNNNTTKSITISTNFANDQFSEIQSPVSLTEIQSPVSPTK
ncbi:hypothetical protein PIROE2DRAFT_12374 [Piromyces sp. E2]|nr:hypothetical protein PIROE2DRAFT_12374 [Piromyces sp. E2]|eukprot:OUM61593.1 hypothetical protein PIROE2DRAFT_12374 [Piromyces sp. E2]